MSVEKQVAIIFCGTKGLLKDVPVKDVKKFETEYLDLLDAQHRPLLDELRAGKLTDEITGTLEKVCLDLASKYKA